MFNLRSFLSSMRSETEEEFSVRMEQLRAEMEDLAQKRPEEVTGKTEEGLYYGMKAGEAIKAGDKAEGRRLLDEMLRVAPLETGLRFLASSCYLQLEDETEAVTQLAIILALEPENFAVHKRLAIRLMKQGETHVAQVVLEKGWVYYRKQLAKADWETGRARYFSVLPQTT